MPLIKNGHFADDSWRSVADGEALPEGAPVIVSLSRWQADKGSLIQRNAPLGLRLKSNESPVDVADDLQRFSMIAIEFPSFRDGRGFSYGRRLRTQLGFTGEIRAVGHILPDQALFLDRCGFDAFEVKEGAKLSDWQRGLNEFSVWFQPALDGRTTAIAHRRARQDRMQAAE